MTQFDAASVADRMTEGEKLTGGRYPRNLQETAPLALPVSVSVVPTLTTQRVQNALFAITGRTSATIQDRRLRGCLVAHRGRGLIFLDEDRDTALRFAAAHEIAHFVGHYLDRRTLAMARLGPGILEVLDGVREATPAERIGGILAGCPLGVFTDVMERDQGQPTSEAASAMEYEADEAAFLALAPIGIAIKRTLANSGELTHSAVRDCLESDFGLSPIDAGRHAPRVMSAAARSRPTFIEGLRAAASRIALERQK